MPMTMSLAGLLNEDLRAALEMRWPNCPGIHSDEAFRCILRFGQCCHQQILLASARHVAMGGQRQKLGAGRVHHRPVGEVRRAATADPGGHPAPLAAHVPRSKEVSMPSVLSGMAWSVVEFRAGNNAMYHHATYVTYCNICNIM